MPERAISTTWRSFSLHLALFVVAFAIYTASGCWRVTPYNAHVYLADAFLNGRLHLVDPPGHFELAWHEGRAYLNYGFAPALLMLPLVAIWGQSVHQALLTAALGALTVNIWWSILKRLALSTRLRVWLLVLWALGSPVWFTAGRPGTTWFLMHVVTILGLSLAIRECLGARRGVLVALYLGLAISSRQLSVLTMPIFLYWLWRAAPGGAPDRVWPDRLRRLFGFGLVTGGIMGINGLYNFLRFDDWFDNGYARFIAKDHPPYGIFSPSYLGDRLRNYFWHWPKPVTWVWPPAAPDGASRWPIRWLDPSLDGPPLWLSYPGLWLLFWASFRTWENRLLMFAAVLAFMPYLFYYWSGFTQFGCRYFMDVWPLFMVVIADAARTAPPRVLYLVTCLGILVELWGISAWAWQGWG
jgi:hypothetical protein